MKSGHVITACVVVGIALLIGWIARNTYWDEATLPMPPKGEARTNSLYAAQRLSESLGATSYAQRALDSLPDTNSVIYLSYWNWNLVSNRRERLQRWVESGGRLVADRSLIGGERALEDWTGITRSELPVSDKESPPARAARCADTEVEFDESESGWSRSEYRICGADPASRLIVDREASWILSDAQGIHALRMDIGRGSITLLNANPFEQRKLFEGDNALLFVAATQIDRGDRIYFLSEEESPSLAQLIWMHAAPAVMLAFGAIALALWRGSARFGPPAAVPDPARRSLAEQIIGSGRFILRFGGGRALHAASARALHEAAQRHVRGYSGLQNEARIAAIARSTGLDEDALAEAINYSGHRRAGELRKVIALLETARRNIS